MTSHEKSPENKEKVLSEEEIVQRALNLGILKNESMPDLRLGVIKNYVGEGVVEANGERYRVKGWPPVTGEGGEIIKDGEIQVYKMRPWQE